jgi:5-methylcytosine-specific restriction endonuclease McrA
LCDELLGPDAHVDHILPLAAGGTHTKDNLRILCPSCNCSRPIDGSDVTNQQMNIWMAA